jgi:hypothetical protein
MPDLHADRLAALQRQHAATEARLLTRAQRAEDEASRFAAANRLLVALCLALCAALLASVTAWSVWGP